MPGIFLTRLTWLKSTAEIFSIFSREPCKAGGPCWKSSAEPRLCKSCSPPVCIGRWHQTRPPRHQWEEKKDGPSYRFVTQKYILYMIVVLMILIHPTIRKKRYIFSRKVIQGNSYLSSRCYTLSFFFLFFFPKNQITRASDVGRYSGFEKTAGKRLGT